MQYLKTQPAAKITMLLEKRVFPLYLMVAPSPYVLANANWMLGELANCLPEVREALVYISAEFLFFSAPFCFLEFEAGFDALGEVSCTYSCKGLKRMASTVICDSHIL